MCKKINRKRLDAQLLLNLKPQTWLWVKNLRRRGLSFDYYQMLEDELTIVITTNKQLLCEELTCTTHRQQLISVKNHNKQ
jgi:hypothetical protein